MAASCPNAERWQQHLDGTLARNVQDELTAHLDQCADCQQTLEHLAAGGDSLLDVARQVGQATEASEGVHPLAPELLTVPEETCAEAVPAADDDLAFLGVATKPGALGRLKHYEALEVVGKGGFGIVLKAFDDKLHRMVAIKVLVLSLAASGTARKRFIREAQAAAAVKNEHIVAIYNVEDEAQPPYLVMELIDGVSLQDKLDKQGPLSLKEILRIGMQMAEGLAAAHKQGLVHRDIKPSNILLENGVERVKITDFGLARAVDDASVTQSGVIAGTPMYMSPEQANGENIDHRSDLFSLGTVLYVMCTGRPPFRATGTMAVLKRVIEEKARPIREINPEIPEWLCDIIDKLHAKKSEERFQSAKEVAELLGERLAKVQAGRAPGEPSRVSDRVAAPADRPEIRPLTWPGSPGRRVALWALLALVPLLLLAVLVVRHFQSDSITDPPQKTGVLSLRLGDMAMQYRIDGHGANQTGVGVIQLPMDPGQHKVWFALGDRQFETAPFTIVAGKTIELSLEVKGDDGIAILNGKPLGVNKVGAEPGWVQLFNGKDLGGWKYHAKWRGTWDIEDSELVGRNGPTYLQSDREFENFHLIVEMKSSGGTGIYFRAASPGEYPVGWIADTSGFALQRGEPAWKPEPRLAQPAVPSNTWFKLEIVAVGDEITLKVNDTTYVTHRVERSVAGKGLLMLHAHQGSVVRFRSIAIKELPPEEPGWVQLFNGKDLTGWRPGRPQDNDKWRVENGQLVGAGQIAHLYSARSDYANFHIRARVKVNAVGDAGMWFRVPASTENYEGYEAQINSGSPKQKTGSLGWAAGGKNKQLHASKSSPVSADTWFTLEIIARGSHIKLMVDGKVFAELHDDTHRSGSLVLEAYAPGTVVHFSKIEIKELPGTPAASPPLAVAPFDAKKAGEHQDAWAKHLGVDVEIKNSIGMKLRLIPPGKFLMGSPDDEWGREPHEGPQHEVSLTSPFFLGAHPVTIGQFRAFVKDQGYKTLAEKGGGAWRPMPGGGGWKSDPQVNWSSPGFEQTDNHPVVCLTWQEAKDFCDWLSKRESRQYALPTEAQWEYACRAGSQATFPFGKRDDLDQYAWFFENCQFKAQPVGSKKPNAWGLFDMHGNVRNMTADWYSKDYYQSKAEEDPAGPGSGIHRVSRGGDWYAAAHACRAAFRLGSNTPTQRFNTIGFRVALVGDLKPQTPPLAVAPFDAAKAKEHQDAWAKHLGVPVEIENSIGMKLRLIPPGEFTMGYTREQIDLLLPEMPETWEKDALIRTVARQVRIAEPYYAGAQEVTVEQFRKFVDATKYRTTAEQTGKGGETFDHDMKKYVAKAEYVWSYRYPATEKLPVIFVTAKDAEAFCAWLGNLDGRKYALLSEEQWEYACRAGTATLWWTGDDKAELLRHERVEKGVPGPAGSLKANPFGLHDMHGNVSEWVRTKGGVGTRGIVAGNPARNAHSATGSIKLGEEQARYGTGFRVAIVGDLKSTTPRRAVAPFDEKTAKEHQDAWARYRGWPVEVENSIGMKLRLIPPGEFDMGAGDKDADARPEEKPRRRAVIRHSFYMGATEVTRQQYQAVMKQGGKFDPKPILDHPVVAVSWHDATRFCKQLSELDAEKKAGRVYRLPAEVEWEYACRAGTQTPFYFGDIGKMEEYAWFTDNCGGFTNPVAKLKANPWGLYDMLGNVEEWCADTYQGYAAGKIEHDPTKPLPFGTGNNRVARSGSYLMPAKRVTATARTQINPVFATPSMGLRVVMIIDPRVKKQPSAKTTQLFNIGLAYHNYYDVNRKGPATADDLKPFLADDPKAFDALKKGEVVFVAGEGESCQYTNGRE